MLPALRTQQQCCQLGRWYCLGGVAVSVAQAAALPALLSSLPPALRRQWHCLQEQPVSSATPAGWQPRLSDLVFVSLWGSPRGPACVVLQLTRAANAATQCSGCHTRQAAAAFTFSLHAPTLVLCSRMQRFWPRPVLFRCCSCVSCLPLCNKKVYTCSVSSLAAVRKNVVGVVEEGDLVLCHACRALCHAAVCGLCA